MRRAVTTKGGICAYNRRNKEERERWHIHIQKFRDVNVERSFALSLRLHEGLRQSRTSSVDLYLGDLYEYVSRCIHIRE